MPEAREVLEFWFGASESADFGKPRSRWFRKSDAFDRLIAQRYGDLVQSAIEGRCNHWAHQQDCPDAPLALILLIDQFPRNIYRGTSRMFAGDTLALLTAQKMVAAGHDQKLLPVQRQFCYLPFTHAENPAVQLESLRLFQSLRAYEETADVYVWAQKHALIIEQFGRYPHRNKALGRLSTTQELEFLKQAGSSF